MPQLFSMPPVGQKFARAKAQLKRDDTIRALESILTALDEYEPGRLPRQVCFEIEVLIAECVQDLNRQPAVRNIFQSLAKSKNAALPYTPGEEKKLHGTLILLHKALSQNVKVKEEDAAEKKLKRKCALEQSGLEHLRSGDKPRGRASFRLLAEEYGDEPGLLAQLGEWFMQFALFFEAAEMLEQAMERFPKESKAYGLAAKCYTELREFEKAESVYLRAVKQFGSHPRTLLNMAKLYMQWNKKEEAFRAAQEAWNKDNSLSEAREIADKFA
ncbi:tetratricopeptide repeat protein [Desulfovibrio sp. OttesenSCG-928-A18]|nr:tetratricopeptide repeat protein [Desulfovibrio sp. OttesenSCG-928-A18]